jgi:uncharacterized cofD-like protein
VVGEIGERSGPRERVSAPRSSNGPRVVAFGGGHGLAVALRAIRRYAGDVTAVVSVADDGGSSGRLRRDLGVPPPGDIRRCLVALAGDDTVWAAAFEHRFSGGELDGHALGNLVLVGLAETLGSFSDALEEAGRLLHAVGRVLPATSEPVELRAQVLEPTPRTVSGQVAVANTHGIRRVAIVPEAPEAPEGVLAAIAAADQVVLAPGSLYTSVIPPLLVPAIRDAIAAGPGRVVQVSNLRPQVPETAGLDATDHLEAVLGHGVRVDAFVYDIQSSLHADPARIRAHGVEPVAADVAREGGGAHDPVQLAITLRALV